MPHALQSRLKLTYPWNLWFRIFRCTCELQYCWFPCSSMPLLRAFPHTYKSRFCAFVANLFSVHCSVIRSQFPIYYTGDIQICDQQTFVLVYGQTKKSVFDCAEMNGMVPQFATNLTVVQQLVEVNNETNHSWCWAFGRGFHGWPVVFHQKEMQWYRY